MSVETDAILRRYFAKQNAPSIETNLLNSIGSDPVLDDNQFSARHSTGLGIANEGIGNFVNTIRNIGNRDKQAVAARNKLAGENYDRLITSEQGRLDNVFKQQEFEADQANNLADRLSREKVAATNANKIDPLNAFKLKQAQEAKAREDQLGNVVSGLLTNAVDPTDINSIRQAALEAEFQAEDIPEITKLYQDNYNQLVGDETKYVRQQEAWKQDAQNKFHETQIAPLEEQLQDTLRTNNVNEAVIESILNPKNNIKQGQLLDVVKEIVGDGEKDGISPGQYNDLAAVAKYMYSKTGGVGIDRGMLEDALIIASKSNFIADGTDVLTDEAEKTIDGMLADKGYGTSDRAKAVRKTAKQVKNITDTMKTQTDQFNKQLEHTQADFKKNRRNLSVVHNMGRSDTAPQGIGLFADHPLAQQFVAPLTDAEIAEQTKQQLIKESEERARKLKERIAANNKQELKPKSQKQKEYEARKKERAERIRRRQN